MSKAAHRSQQKARNPGLELFFDLVFVLCVSQLSSALFEEPTWSKLATVLLLFVPVWWSWTGVTFVLNRFPDDGDWTNVALLLAAAGSGAMALAIPLVPGSGEGVFAAGYASVRVIISLMYLRARSRDDALATFYAAGFGTTGLVWIVSIAVPSPAKFYVWGIAMIADIMIPVLADRTQRITPVDENHLPDRFGAFAIIVLGEAAVNTVSVARRPLAAPDVVVLALSFVLAALLWWGFFDKSSWQARYRSLADHDHSGRTAYVVCAYLHFPLVAGVILVGAGTQVAVEHPGGHIELSSAILVASGAAAYLVTLNVMTWVLRTPQVRSIASSRAFLVVLLGLWLWLARDYSSITFMTGIAVVLLLHVGANIARGSKYSAH